MGTEVALRGLRCSISKTLFTASSSALRSASSAVLFPFQLIDQFFQLLLCSIDLLLRHVRPFLQISSDVTHQLAPACLVSPATLASNVGCHQRTKPLQFSAALWFRLRFSSEKLGNHCFTPALSTSIEPSSKAEKEPQSNLPCLVTRCNGWCTGSQVSTGVPAAAASSCMRVALGSPRWMRRTRDL